MGGRRGPRRADPAARDADRQRLHQRRRRPGRRPPHAAAVRDARLRAAAALARTDPASPLLGFDELRRAVDAGRRRRARPAVRAMPAPTAARLPRAVPAPDRARPHAATAATTSPARCRWASGVAGAARSRPTGWRSPPTCSSTPSPATVASTRCDAQRGGRLRPRGDGRRGWWVPSGRLSYSPGRPTPADERARMRARALLPAAPRSSTRSGRHDGRYDGYDLLVGRDHATRWATRRRPRNDYRVLQPRLVDRPERQPRRGGLRRARHWSSATAVMGKRRGAARRLPRRARPPTSTTTVARRRTSPTRSPTRTALLGDATTRLVYDLFAYLRTTRRPGRRSRRWSATMARETHVADLGPASRRAIQHGFAYSDGFGREIQRKLPAEPGPLGDGGPDVDPRWVGSGWTIFNNKGQPVRQYEPFFTATHDFEFARTDGRQPGAVLRPGRAGGRHPAPRPHLGEGRLRPVAAGELGRQRHRRSPTRPPTPTSAAASPACRTPTVPADLARAAAPAALGAPEQARRREGRHHAATPTVALSGSLAARCLTVAHNRFESPGTVVDERHPVRTGVRCPRTDRVGVRPGGSPGGRPCAAVRRHRCPAHGRP